MTEYRFAHQSFDGRLFIDPCRAEQINTAMLTCLRVGHDLDQTGRCRRCLILPSK